MRKNDCETIRRELDELMLDETCSSAALAHLRECAGCREFHEKQTKLRQMVGSLGTVAAPPDFDFRLRARLAGESSSAGFQLNAGFWSIARRGVAVAALLLLIATSAVVVRNVMNRRADVADVTNNLPPQVPPQKVAETGTAAAPENFDRNLTAGIPEKPVQSSRGERLSQPNSKIRRPVVAMDLASERADVITAGDAVAASITFPIDASLQSIRVSLDDGRGNARTISVPAISFGSQRMGQSANQFAPKRVW